MEQIKNDVGSHNNEDFEKVKELWQRKIDKLESGLINAENNFKEQEEEQLERFKLLQNEFNESQTALEITKKIIDKLKISSPGFYSLPVSDAKEMQQLFHERLYLSTLDQKRK